MRRRKGNPADWTIFSAFRFARCLSDIGKVIKRYSIGAVTQIFARPSVFVDETMMAQNAQIFEKVRTVLRPVSPFQPILFEKGENGGLPKCNFPQNAQQRCQCLLQVAFDAENTGHGVGFDLASRFRSGAQAKVVEIPAIGCSALKMRDFMNDDAGFATDPYRSAIPSKGLARWFVDDFHGEASAKVYGLTMMDGVLRQGKSRAGNALKACGDSPKDLLRQCFAGQTAVETVQKAGERLKSDRAKNHVTSILPIFATFAA